METLKKSEIDEYVKKYIGSLKVEVIKGSKPMYFLEILIKNGTLLHYRNLGRVSKRIFHWYKLVPMDKQQGYINIIDYKFDKPNTDQNDQSRGKSE